jgi:hypothetical protein
MADVAREIAPDVFCLGPWGRTQTTVYFVRSGTSWVLIDAGWANDRAEPAWSGWQWVSRIADGLEPAPNSERAAPSIRDTSLAQPASISTHDVAERTK